MSTDSHAKNIIIAKKRNLQGSQFKLTLALGMNRMLFLLAELPTKPTLH